MSIMGARLGLAAASRVGRHRKGNDLKALYRHATCAIDGIMAALGTTPGNSNLEIRPEGLHVLEVENQAKNIFLRATLTEEALAFGKKYGEIKRAGGSREEREKVLEALEVMDEEKIVALEILP